MLRGHGPAVTASGECTRIMYAGRTEHPRSHRGGRPTDGVPLFTTLVDSKAKRGVVAKNAGYFFLAFFSRICSKDIHDCATLYLVNEIEFGNSDAGFVISTPKLP